MVRDVQTRRASGSRSHSVTAAIPDRRPAICQLPNEQALIAAPPVEKRNAATKSNNRFRVLEITARSEINAQLSGKRLRIAARLRPIPDEQRLDMAIKQVVRDIFCDTTFHCGKKIEIASSHLCGYFERYVQKLAKAAVIGGRLRVVP